MPDLDLRGQGLRALQFVSGFAPAGNEAGVFAACSTGHAARRQFDHKFQNLRFQAYVLNAARARLPSSDVVAGAQLSEAVP
eukprot:6199128-Pleurochrysis_carterae.AAC.1